MRNYAYYSNLSFKTKFLNRLRTFFIAGNAEEFLLKKILASNTKTLWHKAIPPEYLYPKNSWRTYDRNGIKLKLDISNVVDHLKYYSFKDQGFENFIKKIQPNFTVLDIGGNIGVTCLEFAKKASSGKVIVFEPSPTNYKRLTENIGLNSFNNIIAINKGIGDIAGQFSLYNVVDSNPGMKRIMDNANTENFESETIVIDTLENQLQSLHTDVVNAIKIDVEGFEFKVLQSAANILSKHKPVLFIELDDSNLLGQKSNAKEMVQFLRDHQYNIYNAQDMSTPLGEDFNYSNCHFDIICE